MSSDAAADTHDKSDKGDSRPSRARKPPANYEPDSSSKEKKGGRKRAASSKAKGGSKGGKKGGKRAKKDKNSPKRPNTAFILFSNDERPKIKASSPDMAFGDIAREISDRWRNADDGTKKKYEGLAAKDKERYNKEKAAYDKKKKDGDDEDMDDAEEAPAADDAGGDDDDDGGDDE